VKHDRTSPLSVELYLLHIDARVAMWFWLAEHQ
jgi:hypothetical protein